MCMHERMKDEFRVCAGDVECINDRSNYWNQIVSFCISAAQGPCAISSVLPHLIGYEVLGEHRVRMFKGLLVRSLDTAAPVTNRYIVIYVI